MEIKFGKYAGTPVNEINNLGYLKWLIREKKNIPLRFLDNRCIEAVNGRIKQLENDTSVDSKKE